MLQRLVLVRHGEAEFLAPDGMDENRHLTGRGLVALEAAYPQTFEPLEGCSNIRFWVSPAVRAYQTALVIANVLRYDREDFETHDSLYIQDEVLFLEELDKAFGEQGDNVTLIAVGHEPFMRRMLRQMTGEDKPFTSGTVASIAFDEGDIAHARLEWYVMGPDDGNARY